MVDMVVGKLGIKIHTEVGKSQVYLHKKCASPKGTSGADPEILHGRWPTGWPPIVNYTGARGEAG